VEIAVADILGPIGGISAYACGAMVGWRLAARGHDVPVGTGFWKGTTPELRVAGVAFLTSLIVVAPFVFIAHYSGARPIQFAAVWLAALGIGIAHGPGFHGLKRK
jgi:hypothetical protein